jgi:hypothetical protein
MTNEEKEISVGSLVTAKTQTAIFSPGEPGVCFATRQVSHVGWEHEPAQHERLKQPGYSFIFQGGGFDGFTPAQVKEFLEVSGLVSKDAADYQFKTVGQLGADYGTGRFDAAFEEQNIETARERSYVPHPRDILRREYDENSRREAYGIEPKRGPDIDLDR